MRTHSCRLAALLLVLSFAFATSLMGQTAAPTLRRNQQADFRATARYFASIENQPLLLLPFFRQMPKGADLHNHLSGAIYAESYLKWAAEDGLCIETSDSTAVEPPCNANAGKPPAADAFHNDLLYRQVIDAWSMRDFVPTSGNSGHDHFFDTFAKFDLAEKGHHGDMLAEVMENAAEQHLLYLELMDTLAAGPIGALADRTGWDPDLARLQAKLEPGIPAVAADASRELDRMQTKMRADLACGTAQAQPGCAVQVRFLYQVLRGLSPQVVYAQILTAFYLARHDSRVAGLNLVMPEDGYTAMHDFRLQMSMLNYLHGLYPQVHITLHAGELAPGMVPPPGLRFHIRDSIQEGHATRIGHGVDIMGEDHPFQLLEEMARRHILVEICLTSNRVILGITGKNHPLPIYLRYHVPVALATDDAGVSRSTMSREFVEAEEEFHLPYPTFRRMVRDSLEHAFVQGGSLWRAPENFHHRVAACAEDVPGEKHVSARCGSYLQANEKAKLEWEEEVDLARFQHRIAMR